MNRMQWLMLIGLAWLAGSACVAEENGSLFVVRNERLSGGAGACGFEPSLDGDFLARGTLDISLTDRYLMHPTVLNQLQQTVNVRIVPAGGGAGGAGAAGGGGAGGGGGINDFRQALNETNAIILDGARVSFTTPPGLSFALPSDRFIPVSGTVQPAALTTTALEVLGVDLGNIVRRAPEFFDPGTNTFRRGAVVTVLVEIRFEGKTATGIDVESNTFRFPLDICAGCLLVHTPGTLAADDDNSLTCDPSKVVAGMGGAALAQPETPCIIGQDQAVDCTLCRTLVSDDALADELCDP